ncbi:hypothetical protein MY5147_005003 [Beauveria neobassiana]|uniref:Uncharacterized protein n=1 Tax=Beauveria bassiana TaxID=176275 RepID=A0A2S7XXW4_BEABA|nr:hypothetical protein BB8028_0001g07990 [Beauveria bassiana]
MSLKVIQIGSSEEDPQGYSHIRDVWMSIRETIRERSQLIEIVLSDDFGSILQEPKPLGVLVLAGPWNSSVDSEELNSQTSILKEYAKKGGNVVYAGNFAALTPSRDIAEVFGKKGFNTGWSFGKFIAYNADGRDGKYKGSIDKKVNGILNRNAEVCTNDSLNLQAQLPEIIDSFQPLVVTVENPDHVLYSISDPNDKDNYKEKKYGVGAMARVGEGHVGLWGDRDNKVAQTADVIPAMLGLPPKQQQ